MSLRTAGACAAATAAVLGLGTQVAVADTGLSDKVASQIAALQQVKRSLTPIERKLDSRLVVTLRRRAGADADPARGPRRSRVPVRRGAGRHPRHECWARPAQAPAARGRHGRVVGGPDGARPGPGRRPEDRRVMARRAAHPRGRWVRSPTRSSPRASPPHAVDLAHAAHRCPGIGTKVCALSDGVDSLEESQAAGELPDVDVLARARRAIRRRGHGDAGDRPRHGPGRAARLRHRRRRARARSPNEHPSAALRGGLRRAGRRHPVLQREPVPGRNGGTRRSTT